MILFQRAMVAATTAVAIGVLLSATPAAAQKVKPPTQIKITNMRAAPVTTFEIATTGEQARLVAKLNKPLEPGKSATLKLNKPAGCTYYILARFSDDVESDGENMDLCKEKVIRLTE